MTPTPQSRPELKLCPFCGGAAEEFHTEIVWFECAMCGVKGRPHRTRAEAVAAWNTRTAPEAAPVQATPEMRRLLNTAREALAGGRYGKAERAIESLQDVFDRAPSHEAGDGWMPIKTCPSNGRPVWVFGGSLYEAPARSLASGKYWRAQQAFGNSNVPTHWKEVEPVPAPPATPTDGDVA